MVVVHRVCSALLLAWKQHPQHIINQQVDTEAEVEPGQQHPSIVQVLRLVPSGSPIFSFCKDGWNDWGDNRKQVFCGNMAREILAWEPGDETVQETVREIVWLCICTLG